MVTTLNFATATIVELRYLQVYSEQNSFGIYQKYRSIVFEAMK